MCYVTISGELQNDTISFSVTITLHHPTD